MPLKNYTDISKDLSASDAGFEFEFRCDHCPTKWKSPLKPFRRGRLVGLLHGLSYLFSGAHHGPESMASRYAGAGLDEAREAALAEAQALAATRFAQCERCSRTYCTDCFGDGADVCQACAREARGNGQAQHGGGGYGRGHGAAAAGGVSCPNCGTAGAGGRFCAECGFDMASTHKSCPQCSAMTERSARFCADCGHGF
jgi:hypothetical protein